MTSGSDPHAPAPMTHREPREGDGVTRVLLSYGGGVNSTALAVLAQELIPQMRTALFADTGGEHPETYQYIEATMQPWFAENGWHFEVLRGSRWHSQEETLEAYENRLKGFPNRKFRGCTNDFKKQPIREWIKRNGSDWVQAIAIAADESHRVNDLDGKVYPLVDWQVTRLMCIHAIRGAGLPIPRKSGCFFCPFARNREFWSLAREHPDLAQRVIDMEEHAKCFPEFTIKDRPMREIMGQRRPPVDRKAGTAYEVPCPYCEVGQITMDLEEATDA